MSKAEQIFKSADFSEDTDFKDRLRARLFENKGPASSARSDGNDQKQSVPDRFSKRILSFEELDMVSAAGDNAQYQNSKLVKEQEDPINMLDRDADSQWKNPLS